MDLSKCEGQVKHRSQEAGDKVQGITGQANEAQRVRETERRHGVPTRKVRSGPQDAPTSPARVLRSMDLSKGEGQVKHRSQEAGDKVQGITGQANGAQRVRETERRQGQPEGQNKSRSQLGRRRSTECHTQGKVGTTRSTDQPGKGSAKHGPVKKANEARDGPSTEALRPETTSRAQKGRRRELSECARQRERRGTQKAGSARAQARRGAGQAQWAEPKWLRTKRKEMESQEARDLVQA